MSNIYEEKLSSSYVKQQSVVNSDGVTRRNPCIAEGKPISCIDPAISTLHDVFMNGLKNSKGGPCLGWRPSNTADFQWLTYNQVLDQVKEFGSGLISKGATTDVEQMIGIFSQNRVEWKIVEQTCNSYSMVLVPLYDTLGAKAIEHIVTLCELKIVVVDTNLKVDTLLKGVEDGKYSIKLLIVVKEPTSEMTEKAKIAGVELLSFKAVCALGKSAIKPFVPPKPTDMHTICFTSGTTGLPKGAMLSHRNLVSNITGVWLLGKKDFLNVTNVDVHISYLPLAHVFERVMSGMMYYAGGSVGFFQGDIKLLMGDVAALKPTVFPMVPRLINRMYDKIHQGSASSRVKSLLIGLATNSKLSKLHNGTVTRNTWWDTLVFRKVQNLFGGRARICITGAAPISVDVLNFMRCALGVNFTEGYGQTEATAAISISLPGDFNSGSVGTPALCCEVKLTDVPEKEYYAKDGKGEVCARGMNIFMGYYKDEEKTAAALDEDGWLHTGDIGMWLPNGSLKIIDRKKHIFKLSQGEYIAPEKIEQIMIQCVPIAQIYVHGESLKSSLVAVVVVDAETIIGWSIKKGISAKGLELLIKDPKLNEIILADMNAVGKVRDLKSFELPKKIHITSELFSVENELLTPTFKSRRPQLEIHFESQIKDMYKDLN